MRITVIGGGNIGTLMAAEMLHKGHEVTIYTSKPHLWKDEITVLTPSGEVLFNTKVYQVTDDMGKALDLAELIFITMPARTFKSLGEKIEPYIKPGQIIGFVPGSGGAEDAFYNIQQKGCIIFGFQRVHSIARVCKYGESVYMLGRKDELCIGAIPSDKTYEISSIIEGLFDISCIRLPNYLCVTLTPSNPILHTARLYSMFRDYKSDTIYPRNFLFYEEWTDDASQMLIDCDDELQNLCSIIPLDLEKVISLKKHYDCDTVDTMTNKIRSIEAFKSLQSPMKKVSDGWVPDFDSRYFTSDFSYGLKIIKDIAGLFNVHTPNINTVWNWYETVNAKDAQNAFNLNMNKDEFIELYNR